MQSGDKPYRDQHTNSTCFIRTFDSHVHESELVWHRDHAARIVKVIQSEGWQFQMDNQLPHIMCEGDVIHIPAQIYHRIIAGSGHLVVQISEQEK